ncbi:MAG: hypothetical protein KDB07_08140 [Planctomycetes bacterium]|nr:hypothetical protein [Planctomycetota bacterium]
MLSSFGDEYLAIVKNAGVKRILQGAALGAVGAGLAGQDDKVPHAMAAGALLGSGFKGKGVEYDWRRPAWLGGLGAAGYYGTKALTNQDEVNQAVTNQYTAGILARQAPDASPWM